MSQSLHSASELRPWRRVVAYLGDLLLGAKRTWNPADPDSLSMERTRLAYERTMMAWIRTGVSLISFGFSIYKFFQIQELGIKGAFKEGFVGPRGFGAAMILTGLSVVAIAGVQHIRDLRGLRGAGIKTPPSLAVVVGTLVTLLGFMALIAVTFED